DLPETIMGQEIGDLDGQLDSTRTGIVYLSETISKIAFRKPDNFNETILASKVSGNDNGFSFNTAQDAHFSFYENTINLNAPLVSPIANSALSYYNYKLDGVFYEAGKLINKIRVIPKRRSDRVWSGAVYVVEDDWQLYGAALATTGQALQLPMVTELVFKQNFSFDTAENNWVKRSQTIDFGFDFLGFKGNGRFIAVYSNYNFEPAFKKKPFTNRVLSFGPGANKKDSVFWASARPVPLTDDELNDYTKKDSIQTLRKSKTYLDSIDAKSNRFKIPGILMGHRYKNTYNKWELNYSGPIGPDISFNTVQGWKGTAGLDYVSWEDENRARWFSARVRAEYGLSDNRLRFRGRLTRRFNRINRLQVGLRAGNSVQQFNTTGPISPWVNTISSLFFERNYAKFYDLTYYRANWQQELFNGLRVQATIGHETRKPLFNTTGYVTLPQNDRTYTGNNPLAPNNLTSAAIQRHSIFKSYVRANITFGQKYMLYPDGKYNLSQNKYPALQLGVENGLGASVAGLNYTRLSAQLYQSVRTGSTGGFTYRVRAGAFFGAENISFVDYRHFNGNQTRIGTSARYTSVFNLLPYYLLSTNKSYVEAHVEHDFKGWVLGKIPIINSCNFNLVAGAHFLGTAQNRPYSEFSVGVDNLGFGKFRLLRLDYVKSYYNGNSDGAFIFGLKFLDIIE
ncbi:MAG: DUF5686 family protein, partial [Marinirhabdus sp.]